jgi:cell division protein FtsB
MEHTKEPWFYGSFGRLLIVGSEDGKPDKHYPIADLGEQTFPSSTEEYANAHRIVACVNACEGIPTDGVEAIRFAVTLREMAEDQEQLETLRAENQRLRDQIKQLKKGYFDNVSKPKSNRSDELDCAYRTIENQRKMLELDEPIRKTFTSEIKQLKGQLVGLTSKVGHIERERDELRDELAACQKDAERYRYIKEYDVIDATWIDSTVPYIGANDEYLDQALDAAIAAQKEANK